MLEIYKRIAKALKKEFEAPKKKTLSACIEANNPDPRQWIEYPPHCKPFSGVDISNGIECRVSGYYDPVSNTYHVIDVIQRESP